MRIHFYANQIYILVHRLWFLQMNKNNLKISSHNLSESLIVKFDNLENHGSICTNSNAKLLEENKNLAKTSEELKQENVKLRQMVKAEKENSKKLIQKYEKEIELLKKRHEQEKIVLSKRKV